MYSFGLHKLIIYNGIMKNVIYILIAILLISCSGENVSNTNTPDDNSTLSNLLSSANKEISELGESATEKDGIIESISKELGSRTNNIELLNNRLEELLMENLDLNNQNLSLSDEIKKLIEEKLLLEMSFSGLQFVTTRKGSCVTREGVLR